MRRKVKNRNIVRAGLRLQLSKAGEVHQLRHVVRKEGNCTQSHVRAFDVIKEKTGNPNPLEIFDLAMQNAGPLTEVRSKRIGGANYQVPIEVRPERRLALAMRWIRDAARSEERESLCT